MGEVGEVESLIATSFSAGQHVNVSEQVRP